MPFHIVYLEEKAMCDTLDFSKWSCMDREENQYALGENDIRRWYQRDIDQITHSIGFRKLQRKSQLLSEKDPRSRSRLIHTIEVSRISTEICEELGLSKELAEAISLGHDIGTSPYGYIGNTFLAEKSHDNFSHELAGYLILLWLSKKEITSTTLKNKAENKLGKNTGGDHKLVLVDSPFELVISKTTRKKGRKNEYKYYCHHISPEILDGVLNHGSKGKPGTLEGQVVQFADNIAYLSQDIEDMLTTQIIDEMEFTKKSQEDDVLIYTKKENGIAKEFRMSWNEIDYDDSLISLREAFSASRGKRIATLIRRFVDYNMQRLEDISSLPLSHSEIFNAPIPQLTLDKGMQFVIDYVWWFIEQQYHKPLIATSNEIQKAKMEQLWVILHDSDFKANNTCYGDFLEDISCNTLFKDYNEDWKIAYFISNLSWQEVDLIIDSYHERNLTFDLDLELC